MSKILLAILLSVLYFTLLANSARAEILVVTESAKLQKTIKTEEYDYRIIKLQNYLKTQNSPLSKYSDNFVANADRYGLDWRLIPAISGVESTFGKNIPTGSFNAYGWANGAYYFESWEDSIYVVSKTLREKYLDRGANTLPRIARRYAASTSWEWKVRFFMSEIDSISLNFNL